MRSLLPADPGEPDLESVYAYPGAPDPSGTGPAASSTSGDGRSFVRGNFVSTVDGAIEVDGRSGPLGGAGDALVFALLRSLADVVLVGAGTARTEGYGPASMSEDRRRRRAQRGQRPVPPIAVVTRRGLEADSRLLVPTTDAPPPIVLTTAAAAARAPEEVRRAADVVVCGPDRVDLEVALDALADRGLSRVLCEGGPRLLTDLAAAGRLDELCLTVAPQLAGPGRSRMTDGEPWAVPRSLRLAGALEQDGDLFLRYRPA